MLGVMVGWTARLEPRHGRESWSQSDPGLLAMSAHPQTRPVSAHHIQTVSLGRGGRCCEEVQSRVSGV